MLVTICIPTSSAKRAPYLREAIASAAEQTYRNFEVLVADNSGDEDYHAVVAGIVAEFPQLKIRLLCHPRQLEPADSFNFLVDAARGDGWLLLPDDDLLCPAFLSRAVEALARHPECGFTFADHWLMDQNGRIDEAASDANSRRYGRAALREGVYKHDTLFGLALDQAICLQTMVLRKDVLASVRFPPVVCVDHALALKLGAGTHGVDGYYVNERVFKYRLHGGQITSSLDRKENFRSCIVSFEECGVVPAASEARYRQQLADGYMSLAFVEAETRDTLARKHALHSLRLAPGLRRALGATLIVALPWAVAPVRRLRSAISAR